MIFSGIFDPSIIEAALERPGNDITPSTRINVLNLESRVQLVNDWASIVDSFSWRQQPRKPDETRLYSAL